MSNVGNSPFIVLLFVTFPHKCDTLYLFFKLECLSLEIFVHRNNIHEMKLISQFGKSKRHGRLKVHQDSVKHVDSLEQRITAVV